MRAYESAVAALDADFRIPDGDRQRDVALFPLRRGTRECAVVRERAHRQFVTTPGHDFGGDFLHEFRSVRRNDRRHLDLAGGLRRNLDFLEVRQGVVHGGEVLLDDLFTLLAVGLLDCLFDLLDGLIARQHAGNREEAGLHDRIHAGAHTRVFSDLIAVNHVELELLINDLLLHRPRDFIPHFIRPERAVEKKHGAL